MGVIHGRGGGGEWKKKREYEPRFAAASLLRYHVILEDTEKAIIIKHYENSNANVPVSIPMVFSLIFTDRQTGPLTSRHR